MNEYDIQIGDLVTSKFYGNRTGIGLVIGAFRRSRKIYWFKFGDAHTSSEHYLTKLCPTQEKENE